MKDGSSPSPVLTPALRALRDGFDQAFPNRDHTTDGWIGDAAHQRVKSGHNPDDTPGVIAEYSDIDTKAEVRAIDVDVDLNMPGVTMQDCIDVILSTPNDLMRLEYIIYNGRIWSKSNGWKPVKYTGVDPHINHSHLSGDPLFDENDDRWSVATMGDQMTDSQAYVQHVMNYRLDGLVHLREKISVPAFTAPGGTEYPAFTEDCQLSQWVRPILDIVKSLQTSSVATPEQIADAVIAEIAS